MPPDILGQNAENSHQSGLIPGLAGLQCVLHGHHCSNGTLAGQTVVHVWRGPGVVDDDGGGVSLLHGELGVQSSHLVVYYERHHGWQELEDQGRLQSWLSEVLRVDHLPGSQAESQHPEEQQEDWLVPGEALLGDAVVHQLHPRG